MVEDGADRQVSTAPMTAHSIASTDVTAYVASFNTRLDTELCLRTLRSTAPGVPVIVGDSGSRDGSLEMLGRFARRRWIQLELAPEGRMHGEWLDHWISTCRTPYAVFVDSDVELLRPGWLDEMLNGALATNSAIAYADFLPADPHIFDKRFNVTVNSPARPGPWLMLVDVAAIRSLNSTFKFVAVPDESADNGARWYDVGAKMLEDLISAGLGHSKIDSLDGAFIHFGGRSWNRPSGESPWKVRLDGFRVTFHIQRALWRLRLLEKLSQRS